MNITSYRQFILILAWILPMDLYSQAEKTYTSLQEIWEDVKKANTLTQNATLTSELAKISYKTAIGNTINPRMPVNINLIDHTRLQSNFIPAEFFGGPSGSFREVAFGQKYNALFSLQPQIDLINLSSIAQIKAAKINQNLTDSQNRMNEKALYENLNTIYHNLVSLKSQKSIVLANISNAEQIKDIVYLRHSEGIARKQDLNEAEVNLILMKDKLEQLEYNIEYQEHTLALFFENTKKPILVEDLNKYAIDALPAISVGDIKIKNIRLQSDMLKQDIKSLYYQNFPTLSLTSSLNWQNLSNVFFYSRQSTTIRYNFVGLKLAWDLPTVSRLSNLKYKQFQLQSLELNELHIRNENETITEQLRIEYQKATSQYKNFKAIAALKADTYQKSMHQYQENILGLDRLLTAHSEMLISQINELQSLSNIAIVKNKIYIHNLY